MVQHGEKDADTCDFNDLALVRIDPADVGKVNPSVPFFGGPTGISTSPTAVGDRVLTFGNSPLRAGVTALSPKEGISLGDQGGGWSHTCYTVSPGIPGDSGSAFLTNDGKALGVLTSLAVAPLAGSNGVGDLSRELRLPQCPRRPGHRLARPGHRALPPPRPLIPRHSDPRVRQKSCRRPAKQFCGRGAESCRAGGLHEMAWLV